MNGNIGIPVTGIVSEEKNEERARAERKMEIDRGIGRIRLHHILFSFSFDAENIHYFIYVEIMRLIISKVIFPK